MFNPPPFFQSKILGARPSLLCSRQIHVIIDFPIFLTDFATLEDGFIFSYGR